jgi:DNA-binding response OmpR family regulator
MTSGGVSCSGDNSGPIQGPGRLRVLVVDDDPDAVITLITLLQHEGHQPRGLYRAQDVMAELKSFDPDVVLMDIALPDGSGYALVEQIRRRCGHMRPMVIALTGVYMRPPHDQLSHIVGCNHFLTKPFDPGQLLTLIAPLAKGAPRPGQ